MERILRWTLVIPRRQSLIFMTLSFGLAMVFSAYIYIPLPWTPVPITLQTFFVFLSGIILRYYGGLSQILYVGLGAIGLPVFAQGFGGISRIFGPTGGYLIGFIIAAIFIGQFYSIRNFFKGLLILFFGLAIIYIIGSFQLWLYTGARINRILLMGVVPFLYVDLVKLLLAHQIGYWARKRRWLDF